MILIQKEGYFISKIGDLVGTEVGCSEIVDGSYNENGSTFINGIVTEIKCDVIKIEVTDPSRHVTMLEVGTVYTTLIDQCWRLS